MQFNDNFSIEMPISKNKKNKLRFLDDKTFEFKMEKVFWSSSGRSSFLFIISNPNQLFAEGINYIVTLQTYTSISSKVLKQIVEVVISM